MSGAFHQDSAALSLYAVGKLTGCVVDVGHGKTHVAPVNEGQLQAHGMQKLDVAGEDMSTLLKDLVGRNHQPLEESCGGYSN